MSEASGRSRGTLALLAAFTLGLVAGAALLHIVEISMRGGLRGLLLRRAPVAHLSRELDLTPEQVRQLRAILTESRTRMREEADTTRGRIRSMLSEEQRRRFEEIGPPPPPPPPPPGAAPPPPP